jgi:hypothetical protein
LALAELDVDMLCSPESSSDSGLVVHSVLQVINSTLSELFLPLSLLMTERRLVKELEGLSRRFTTHWSALGFSGESKHAEV